jgi:hypothetical protein
MAWFPAQDVFPSPIDKTTSSTNPVRNILDTMAGGKSAVTQQMLTNAETKMML